jgi:hypothetical protein
VVYVGENGLHKRQVVEVQCNRLCMLYIYSTLVMSNIETRIHAL